MPSCMSDSLVNRALTLANNSVRRRLCGADRPWQVHISRGSLVRRDRSRRMVETVTRADTSSTPHAHVALASRGVPREVSDGLPPRGRPERRRDRSLQGPRYGRIGLGGRSGTPSGQLFNGSLPAAATENSTLTWARELQPPTARLRAADTARVNVAAQLPETMAQHRPRRTRPQMGFLADAMRQFSKPGLGARGASTKARTVPAGAGSYRRTGAGRGPHHLRCSPRFTCSAMKQSPPRS